MRNLLALIVVAMVLASVIPVGLIAGLLGVPLGLAFQRAVIHQSLDLLGADGRLLQYSYSPISPIPARKLGVEAKLVKFVVRNVPPATLWRFRRRRASLDAANGHE